MLSVATLPSSRQAPALGMVGGTVSALLVTGTDASPRGLQTPPLHCPRLMAAFPMHIGPTVCECTARASFDGTGHVSKGRAGFIHLRQQIYITCL